MKIINTNDLRNTERQVNCPKGGFISLRALLESDGCGFSITRTIIPKDDPQFWHYKDHIEACYCLKGEGELTDLKTGKKHYIKEGIIYALDKNDPHEFQALTNSVELLCVFNPPLIGNEVHNEEGSYDVSITSL